MTDVVVGLDLGTGGVRAIAVDLQGQIIAQTTRSYPLFTPQPGWTGQNPSDWVEASLGDLFDVAQHLNGRQAIALGLSGQMHGMVPCLSLNDCFTSKLLSNSDRYMDDSIEARDLIDLAVLRLQSPLPSSSIDKAEKAYEVIRPLKKAIERFQERPNYRQECFQGLQIDEAQIPKIIDGVDLLSTDLGLSLTPRVFREQHDIFTDLETP